jgi:hypothetical protein
VRCIPTCTHEKKRFLSPALSRSKYATALSRQSRQAPVVTASTDMQQRFATLPGQCRGIFAAGSAGERKHSFSRVHVGMQRTVLEAKTAAEDAGTRQAPGVTGVLTAGGCLTRVYFPCTRTTTISPSGVIKLPQTSARALQGFKCALRAAQTGDNIWRFLNTERSRSTCRVAMNRASSGLKLRRATTQLQAPIAQQTHTPAQLVEISDAPPASEFPETRLISASPRLLPVTHPLFGTRRRLATSTKTFNSIPKLSVLSTVRHRRMRESSASAAYLSLHDALCASRRRAARAHPPPRQLCLAWTSASRESVAPGESGCFCCGTKQVLNRNAEPSVRSLVASVGSESSVARRPLKTRNATYVRRAVAHHA